MHKYAGLHEIRFKIPDYHFQMFQDMAMYLYEAKAIDKPNLHSFGRFCIMQVTNANIVLMCQWKFIQHIKDRIESFDDYHFPCRIKDCTKEHVWNWLKMFILFLQMKTDKIKFTYFLTKSTLS
jgi:hypothetical protein